MLMLESLEGRGYEDTEVEHSCDTWYTEAVHFDKEMLRVFLCLEIFPTLVKQNCKCTN